MHNLLYSDQVIHKDIPKLSTSVKSLIKITIEKKLLSEPIKFGTPLKHSLKGYRSLGDYRAIYQIVDTTIY